MDGINKVRTVGIAPFYSICHEGQRHKPGRVAEWLKATDCKSVEGFLRRFESCLSHLFVVDFREEKGGIRQRRKAHRAKLFLFLAVP